MALLLSKDRLRSHEPDESMWQRRVRLIREEYAARLKRLRESEILDIIRLTPTEELARYMVEDIRTAERQRLMKEGGVSAVTSYEQRMRQMLARRLEKQLEEGGQV